MIKIYSSERCRYCRELKGYLDKLSIPYQVLDVGKNEKYAKELFDISGQTGIPVSVIGDEVIVGFDRSRIDNALTRL
ncbi:MAG: glutaredoxin family protein [Ruminococcus sp.]|nr:glutaredoxin family protein [Ruminococcus sp.]